MTRQAILPGKPDIPEGFTGMEWLNKNGNYYCENSKAYRNNRHIYFEEWKKTHDTVLVVRVWTNGKIEKQFRRKCAGCIICSINTRF